MSAEGASGGASQGPPQGALQAASQGPPPAGRGRLGWRSYALLALVSLIFFLAGQASLPPVDRDESRYAQATSQMLETGDFIDVRYQDQPRYLQPAGVYWLQSLSVSILSSARARQIWAYRVPSLVFATLSVVLTGWIGSMLFGPEAGIGAALLMAMCALLNVEARMAKIDATLLAVTLTAQAALLRAYLDRAKRTRLNAALFWAAIGAGLMLKGPILLIVSGTTILALGAIDRRFAWLKRLHAGWGVLITLALVLPWFVAIGIRTHGAFFAKSVGQNLLGKIGRGEQSHGAPPGYYLAMVTLTFWPGSLAAVLALPWAWRNRALAQVRFLAAWIIPTWLIYEVIATKLPHYALPFYPAIACLAAGAGVAPGGWRLHRVGKALISAYAVVWLAAGALLAMAGAWLIWRHQGRIDGLACAAATLSIALMFAALWFVSRGRRRPALASAGCAALTTVGVLCGHSLPADRGLWLAPQIAATVAKVRPCPDSVLASSAYSAPSLVFLLGRETRLINVAATADYLSHARACGLALVGARQLPAFQARAAADHLQPLPIARLSGFDYSRGRALDLTLFRADSSRHP